MTGHDAEQDAAKAAARARAAVEEVDSVAGLLQVADLFSRVWAAPQVPPMPHDIMRSLVHAGGRVHAAFRDGRLVGAAVAVFGPPAGPGAEPGPAAVPHAGSGPGVLRCWIPEDMLALRRTDPALARRWRLAVREALGGAVDGGYQVTGVLRAGWYVLEKGRP